MSRHNDSQASNGIACTVRDRSNQGNKYKAQYIFQMIRQDGSPCKPERRADSGCVLLRRFIEPSSPHIRLHWTVVSQSGSSIKVTRSNLPSCTAWTTHAPKFLRDGRRTNAVPNVATAGKKANVLSEMTV